MKTLYISLKIFLVMTILTGVIYPLFVTVIGQTLFYNHSNGSMIVINNQKRFVELKIFAVNVIFSLIK